MLIGRDIERRRIDAAIAGTPPWAVVIDGEAGIGKTALWRACVAGLDPGTLVLTARGAPAETALGFAGLTDLLAGVPQAAIDELPPPQRDALATATLRRDVGGEPVDPRAVSTGLASLLTALAMDRPVVLAVDDVQWLDVASVGPLEFVVRRAPVGVLVTRRAGPGPVPVAEAAPHALSVALGPLTVGALHGVLQQELGHAVRRPVLVRVAEASSGNPMFAVELARALERRGEHPSPGAPLPLPDSLAELTVGRLAALDDEARHTLLHAAVAARPTVALLDAVGAAGGLDAAERAGIASISRGRVELTHPLLAEAAISLAAPPERRAAHAALAHVVDDEEERARHLALAATRPTEAVATALDAAVARTRARGATAAAADLVRLAVEHTPEPTSPAGVARAAALARLSFEVGDAAECERLHRFVLDHSTDPTLRAETAAHLTEVLWERGAIDECVAATRAGLQEVAAEPAVRARLHLLLSFLGADRLGNTAAAAALVDAHDVGAELQAWASYQQIVNGYEAGGPLDPAALDGVLAMEREGRMWHSTDQVANCRAVILKYVDELEAAGAALEELHQRAIEEGNEGQLPYLLGHLVGVKVQGGDLVAAEATARRHREIAEATGQSNQRWQAQVNLALVALARGRLDEAEAAIAEVVAVDDPFARRNAAGALGTIRLRQGDVAGAVTTLDAWWETSLAIGGDVFVSRFFAERVEALLAAGDIDQAADFTADTERRATIAERRSVLAIAARSRALVAAAVGDLATAVAAADEAMARHATVPSPMPIERARTLLVKGQLHRRAKEKAKARDALTEAVATFEACGADGWAAVAADELARVNVRPSAPAQLTATERRIAELAAEGLTNREIATAAFVSAKTVEANLARAYRKLGITSRAQLGRALDD